MKTPKRPRKHDNLLKIIHMLVDTGRYREIVHATLRKNQRNIILPDILFVLCNGYHEKSRDKFDQAFNAWNYAIRWRTIDEHDMRVIISLEEEEQLLIITAFYLGK